MGRHPTGVGFNGGIMLFALEGIRLTPDGLYLCGNSCQCPADCNPYTFDFHPVISRDSVITMQLRKRKIRIELGMKVSVRRSSQNQIGVVTRIEGHYVFVRWINSDFGETA